AVAGATGRVGSHLVDVLEASGHDVVSMSRATGVDVVTGEGLVEALSGVEVVIDAATGPSPDQQAATDFFIASARNLQEAGERAGGRRVVVVSIIGIDRFAAGYYAAKAAHDRAHLSGPIPVRVLRAAQFHEFVGPLAEWGRRDGVAYVPKMRTQLVAARTVARALAELELGPHGVRAVTLRTDAVPEAIPQFDGREALVEGIEKHTMLGRGPTLEDVGNVAAFVASDKARTMTAATANISCGALID
ncbi:MAG TPA: SDR family oxidoreductase, partial [Rubrobacter sp.]|nr:SDR family oxidoreductase [Rubrobacter sp.]